MTDTPRNQNGWDPFPSSRRDKEETAVQVDTPQTRSPTYALAYA